MTKKELIKMISMKSEMPQSTVKKVIDELTDSIADILVRRDRIMLPGFGIFETRYRDSKIGVNPSTQEQIQIPACYAPVFKASKALKEQVK